MTRAEFVELVQRMRSAQKSYFRTRDPADLERSKQLAELVAKQIREEQDRQRKLF
tara:strand:- start:4485 stop:4649 length:165 start_codon:yes stop_codon:yes gene_type:complete